MIYRDITTQDGVLHASRVVMGCMRINGMEKPQLERLISGAIERGVNFFDHADIYGGGSCEEVFGKAYHGARDKIIIQTKCAIRNGYYDFSKEHILEAVDASLRRLGTDYVDVLLLHRPDTLMEPEEVAEAFDTLQKAGKVRAFGVSNENPMQMTLLGQFVKQPLLFNQLQLSMTNTGMINSGMCVNMQHDNGLDRDGSILEYCRIHGVTIQAWSPFQYGFFSGAFIDSDKFPELNAKMQEMAAKYGTTKIGAATAWILRHPAKMQVISGTTRLDRLGEMCDATAVTLSREDWYALYRAAGNIIP